MNQQLEKYLCDEFLVSCGSAPQKSHSWGTAHHFGADRLPEVEEKLRDVPAGDFSL